MSALLPSDDLAPCPFCGGKPSISTRQDESLWSHNIVTKTHVQCVECDIGFETEPGYEREAIAAWNRRTAPVGDAAHQHAVALEQCSLFVEGEALVKAMADAAQFLRSLPTTPGEPTRPSIARDAKWCQPGDRQSERYFIVRFEDRDRGDAVFTDEAEAREFWSRATMNWNCWLFGAMPVAPTAPSREDVARAEEAGRLITQAQALVKTAFDGAPTAKSNLNAALHRLANAAAILSLLGQTGETQSSETGDQRNG